MAVPPDGQVDPRRGILQQARMAVEYKSQHPDPELKTTTAVSLIPPLKIKTVVDFQTWIFLLDEQRQGDFRSKIQQFLTELGYRARTTGVVLSPEWLLQNSRTFLRVSLKKAEADVFFKSFGNLFYVSLRAVYEPRISILRVILFAFICFFLSSPCCLLSTSTSSTLREMQMRGQLSVDNSDTIELGLMFFSLCGPVVNVIVLGAFMSFISAWRGNGLLGWLQARHDELYRDDIASIWSMTEFAIMSVADEMDVEQLPVGQDSSLMLDHSGQLLRRKSRF